MPFMVGAAPIRRTVKYLEAGKIIFRENVRIFSVNYNTFGDHHKGARKLVFWHLPQIQYKNPNVQCITFRNLTPSPFIKIFFEDGKSVLIDIDSRDKEDILSHLQNFTAVCKKKHEIDEDIEKANKTSYSAYFGFNCDKHCMCEVVGQIPCSSLVKLPNIWRGIPEKKKKYTIPPCFMEPGLENPKNKDV